jgi:hypothetical protein
VIPNNALQPIAAKTRLRLNADVSRKTVDPDLEDDETHPIPFVTSLDVVVETNVGHKYGIVIASPIASDERSKRRLAEKVEGYVREFEIQRELWLAEKRTPMRAWLYIYIHPESDAEMLRLVQQYRAWIESRSISVVMSALTQ